MVATRRKNNNGGGMTELKSEVASSRSSSNTIEAEKSARTEVSVPKTIDSAPKPRTMFPEWVDRQHPYILTVILCLFIALAYVNPDRFDGFFRLKYEVDPPAKSIPGKSYYHNGDDDRLLVVSLLVISLLARFAVRKLFLLPLGSILFGEKKKIMIAKFAEAAWMAIYYSFAVSYGVNAFTQEEEWWVTAHFWDTYPHLPLTFETKTFYLVAYVFWLHSIIVLCLEVMRKDFFEMLTHHILTVLMIYFSHKYNYTRVGSAIIITFDIGDMLLFWGKVLQYMKWEKLATTVFVAFMTVWAVTRHYIFPFHIAWSLYAEQPIHLPYIWDDEKQMWMNEYVRYGYLTSFAILEVLLVFWFVLIIKVAVKVLTEGDLEDNRSEVDDDEMEAEMEERMNDVKED